MAIQAKRARMNETVRQRKACSVGNNVNQHSSRKRGWEGRGKEPEAHHDVVSFVTHRCERYLLRREDEDDSAGGETERGEGFSWRAGGENRSGRLRRRL